MVIFPVRSLLRKDTSAVLPAVTVGRLSDFQGTDGQLVIEADAGGSAVGDADHLWILSGTGVAGRNGTVGMPQLLDVISSSVQPGDTDFSVAVRCVRAGYQGGAGGVGIHTETPTGQILTVLRGFYQGNGTRVRGVDLKIGPQCIHLGRIQLDTGLVSAAGTVANGYGGVFRRGQTPGSTE